MSDQYDHEQMDKEVARNMKGQTFIVTIRDQVDSIPVHEIQDAVIREYESSQITGSEIDVMKVTKVSGGPESHLHAQSLDYIVEDAI
jgi:hypothetical protein